MTRRTPSTRGLTDTDMLRAATPPEAMAGVAQMTALGRVGTPADTAAVVALLLSPDAAWLTGQNLVADGARSRRSPASSVSSSPAGSSSAGGTAVAPKLTRGNSSWCGSLEGSGPEMVRILVRLGLRKVLLLGGASSDRRCDRQCDELDSAGDLPRLPSTGRRVQMSRRRRRVGR
ncbi:SDR family oxidoreductase [Streptomyces sp. NPDC053750]|uniref:SDR family oxidoreductase n=1 Tax=Streptomyces sp. NPDC053750 TaxID=3365714 RepID=UPI0037CDB3EA